MAAAQTRPNAGERRQIRVHVDAAANSGFELFADQVG